MITALKLATICELEINKILVYGYTFNRETIVLYIGVLKTQPEFGKSKRNEYRLIRYTETKENEPDQLVFAKFVHPEMFTRNIKRWYKNASNQKLKQLLDSFITIAETDGGERMKNQYVEYDFTQRNLLITNLDLGTHYHVE